MLLYNCRLKEQRKRVVLGMRCIGYDLGSGTSEVSIPASFSGPQLFRHVVSSFFPQQSGE